MAKALRIPRVHHLFTGILLVIIALIWPFWYVMEIGLALVTSDSIQHLILKAKFGNSELFNHNP